MKGKVISVSEKDKSINVIVIFKIGKEEFIAYINESKKLSEEEIYLGSLRTIDNKKIIFKIESQDLYNQSFELLDKFLKGESKVEIVPLDDIKSMELITANETGKKVIDYTDFFKQFIFENPKKASFLKNFEDQPVITESSYDSFAENTYKPVSSIKPTIKPTFKLPKISPTMLTFIVGMIALIITVVLFQDNITSVFSKKSVNNTVDVTKQLVCVKKINSSIYDASEESNIELVYLNNKLNKWTTTKRLKFNNDTDYLTYKSITGTNSNFNDNQLTYVLQTNVEISDKSKDYENLNEYDKAMNYLLNKDYVCNNKSLDSNYNVQGNDEIKSIKDTNYIGYDNWKISIDKISLGSDIITFNYTIKNISQEKRNIVLNLTLYDSKNESLLSNGYSYNLNGNSELENIVNLDISKVEDVSNYKIKIESN